MGSQLVAHIQLVVHWIAGLYQPKSNNKELKKTKKITLILDTSRKEQVGLKDNVLPIINDIL